MDLMEYQAKELFTAHGVPGLPGDIADDVETARQVAAGIDATVVVKAQVKTGGRVRNPNISTPSPVSGSLRGGTARLERE